MVSVCGVSVELMTNATLRCVDPWPGYTHSTECTRRWYLTRELITFTSLLMTLSLSVISSQHSLHPGISVAAIIHQ